MRAPSTSSVLASALSLLALASALLGAYLGTVAALVALTGLLSIRILGGRMELRRWRLPVRLESAARTGPLRQAEAEVREAAAGNRYFRAQIADSLLRAAATKAGGSPGPSRSELDHTQAALLSSSKEEGLSEVLAPGSAPQLKGEAYLSKLGLAMDLIENG